MIQRDGVSPAQDTVRVAIRSDVPAIAALHGAAIDEGFLSSLGVRFLSRLYARLVASPHGFVLVADKDGHHPAIAGFVAGSGEVGRLYREFLWRDGPAVALSSGIRLARSLPSAIETFRYGAADHGRRAEPAVEAREPETELLAMAVDPADRSRGLGTALVEGFVADSRAAGSASARVVVGAANARAIALYTRAGFREDRRIELHAGAVSLLMRADFSRPGP